MPHARVEPLDSRRLLCAQHLDPALVDYANATPADSPFAFGLAAQPAARPARAAAPPPAPSTTVVSNGAPANRVDVVFVGDGYQAGQLGTYAGQVASAAASFFSNEFAPYRTLFNVHRVDVASVDSGVDNDPTQGVLRNTALDSGFWCSGIERLLCVDVSKAYSYAVNAPQVDQVLVIANSSKYGGAGYPGSQLGTFSGGNAASLEVARHEFGHSFGDLADEYDYGGPTVYPGGDSEANVSVLNAAQMDAQNRKWHLWLDRPEVDTFEGADYSTTGVYRPTVNSKMRSLDRPWDAVNTEQLIFKAYETVRPIDAATAPGTYNPGQAFFVDPVDPVGDPLAVTWRFNGQVVGTGTSFAANGLPAFSGDGTLVATVVDDTTLVRNETLRADLMTETRTWQVNDLVAPTATGEFLVDSPAVRLAFSEDVGASLAAGDLVLDNLTGNFTVPTAQLAVSYDAPTRTVLVRYTGAATGALPDGNYRLRLPAGRVTDPAGNANALATTVDFFVLAGDANRDRAVTFADLSTLAQNYGQSGRTFQQGNFDYSADGAVGFGDLAILAGNYGDALPTPQARPGGPAGSRVAADVLA